MLGQGRAPCARTGPTVVCNLNRRVGMTDISVGPFALSLSLMVTFGAIIIGTATGTRVARSDKVQVERLLWLLIGISVLAARAAFVGRYWGEYAAEPWRIVDIRDGGFKPAVGIAAAVVAGLYWAWRRPAQRKAILAGVLAGSLLWTAGTFILTLLPSAGRLPALTLTDINGKKIALDALAGKPVVLNLWASWCPPCRREMPVLERAQRETSGVIFVFVNQGESAETTRHYLASQSLKLGNVLLDPTGKTATAARAPGLPTTLFFDAGGALVDRRMGELSPATLGQGIERLTGPAKKPAVSDSRVLQDE
jgi:thiol-disulfide isomerase/thioredoxin